MTAFPQLRNALLGAILVLAVLAWVYRPVRFDATFTRLPAGAIDVRGDPVQGPASGRRWTLKTSTLTSLAAYTVRARILSLHRYWHDGASDLSPMDLALGWGPMADPAILKQVDIWQQERFYYWSSGSLPLSADQISSHSANTHLVPATPLIADGLRALRAGQHVEITGDLVEIVDTTDGSVWRSSLSRTDAGNGACEVVLVQRLAFCNAR